MHVQVFVRAFEGWTSNMHQNIKEMGSKCYPFIAPAFKHTSAYPLGRHLCCTVHWVGWHLCCSGDMESKTRGGYWAQVGCGQRWVWAVKKEQWIPDGKGWAKNVADIVYPLTKSPVGNSYRLAGKKKNDIGLPEDLGHHQPMINKVTWKKVRACLDTICLDLLWKMLPSSQNFLNCASHPRLAELTILSDIEPSTLVPKLIIDGWSISLPSTPPPFLGWCYHNYYHLCAV